MSNKTILKSIAYGILASSILLEVYFSTLSLISGWDFAQNQFATYWYFVVSLSVGFGIQVGLYFYLKNIVNLEASLPSGKKGVLGVTGTTSTIAMISCCAHYLINILPIIGIAGLATFLMQYQIQLFWVGLLFNLGGIAYMVNKIKKV